MPNYGLAGMVGKKCLLRLFTYLCDNESSTSNSITLSLVLPFVVSPQ